ncbi:MAG TPA: FAD-dependent monooxygenase [Candidatus Dormibacteraeota bacterium]|nr:FAD-dependent monooxygenase [Candidatus Dormibacteraeota bacterium]
MDTEVLIVGAGPTGLMLACQLGRRGVRPLIIDRHSGPAQQTRAIGVQARTLEIYASLGIAPEALELGAITRGANVWAAGKHKARIPVGDIGRDLSPFPYILMLGQDDNERIMGAKLREWGITVNWNTELVALQQTPEQVIARLKAPDGSERTVRAGWVAGCDGSRSAVRERCGIGFPEAPYEHVFFVADTVSTGAMVPKELNVYLLKSGFHLFFPLHGTDRWRLIGILPAALHERRDLGIDDVVPEVRAAVGATFAVQECQWFSTYRISHRRAARFREGRCFLLGDAAHVHSPVGAQGMNTGLQDAYNLAWKLALVVAGDAAAPLLDSYEAERLPVAQRLLETTDQMFRAVVSDTWLAGVLRTRLVARLAAFGMHFQPLQRLVFRTVSQIGIRYRHSPLSRTLPGLTQSSVQAGDRFPWLRFTARDGGTERDIFQEMDDIRFNLIVIGEEGAPIPGYERLVHTQLVPGDAHNAARLAQVHLPPRGFFLCRPDGHVGLAGAQLDVAACARYLADCHLAPRPAPRAAGH